VRAYYAHPLTLYDTPQERDDENLLAELGYSVLNPNAPQHAQGYAESGMDYFRMVIQRCTVFAFRAFPDGSIPSGIVKEIGYARDLGLPVFELPTGVLRRGLSVELTREALHEGGRQ
jgi:hypothetical protein